MIRIHAPGLARGLAPSLLVLAACSQEPYLLDAEAIEQLDGALPDSDPGLLDEAPDEPGHELSEPDSGELAVQGAPRGLDGDDVELPLAPAEAEQLTQPLLFETSPLVIERTPTGWPQRTTVQLTVYWKTGEEKPCSGTLIRPDVVLTAAHCLYRSDRQGFAYSIRATPAMHGTAQVGIGSIWARRSFVHPRYREFDADDDARSPYDYGVLRLKRGFSVGTRTLALGSKALRRAFVLRGYPGDGGERWDGKRMYRSGDRIRTLRTDGLFRHLASTHGGMSGAGVDDGVAIIGVHGGGREDGQNNYGVAFSQASLDLIEDFATRPL